MSDKELDDFIDEAQRRSVDDEWWITEFCEEAESVGRELKELRERLHAAARTIAAATRTPTA